MDYREAIDYLLSFADFERSGRFQDRPDIEPMRALLRELVGDDLGDFNWWFITTHVAGSKGKGSVSAMIESILCEAGKKAGLYSSPHLHSFTERIRTCREPIAEDRLAKLVEERLKPAVVAAQRGMGDRSFVTFDLLTALGLLDFVTNKLEYAVLEVGLGGRVDSTNLLDETDVTVLTAISLEHTAILGDTIEAIAREKAGIIKPGSNVVMGPQAHAEAARIFREAAAAIEPPTRGPAFVDVAADYCWEKLSHDLRGQEIRIEGPFGEVRARIPLLGRHQIENAATAVAAVMALDDRVPSTVDKRGPEIGRGLEKTVWPGRIEVVHEGPLVIVDGAHNRDSARRFVETLREYFDCEKATMVVGTSADKDLRAMAQELAPASTRVFAAKSDHPRAMEPDAIAVAFRDESVDAENVGSVGEAIDKAMASADASGVICVLGSLFVAAEGRAHFGLG